MAILCRRCTCKLCLHSSNSFDLKRWNFTQLQLKHAFISCCEYFVSTKHDHTRSLLTLNICSRLFLVTQGQRRSSISSANTQHCGYGYATKMVVILCTNRIAIFESRWTNNWFHSIRRSRSAQLGQISQGRKQASARYSTWQAHVQVWRSTLLGGPSVIQANNSDTRSPIVTRPQNVEQQGLAYFRL